MIKKGIILLLLCSIGIASFTGCNVSVGIKADITGNGKKVDSSVDLSGSWSSLDISGIAGANVYLSNEKSNSVKYSIDENLEKHLDITENNGKLVIKTTSNKTIKNKDNKGIDFYVGTSELKSIKTSTLVKLEGQDAFTTDDCNIEIADASSVKLDLNCNNLKLDSNGASSINLKGSSKTLNVNMLGAGNLLAKDFKSKDVAIVLEGVSNSEVYAENSLSVKGEGAFNVTYWGEPQLSNSIDGVGIIKKGE